MLIRNVNSLRLTNFPPGIQGIIRNIIRPTAHIQHEGPHKESYIFKLYGFPFSRRGIDGFRLRRMVLRMIANLWIAGWVLTPGVAINVRTKLFKRDNGTIVFRRQIAPLPMRGQWMCVSFKTWGRLRLVDAPDDTRDALIQAIREMGRLRSHEPYHPRHTEGCYNVKLFRDPNFNATDYLLAESPDIEGYERLYQDIPKILNMLEKLGWTIYYRPQLGSHYRQSWDWDAWYCFRSYI